MWRFAGNLKADRCIGCILGFRTNMLKLRLIVKVVSLLINAVNWEVIAYSEYDTLMKKPLQTAVQGVKLTP